VTKGSADTPRVQSIAVLPFRVMDSELGDAYLGLGLTDVIITRLSQIKEIDVRPTSSVLRYADREVDPAEAARELAVDSVLLGRVTKSGERVRVTVQLINVAASSLLWADKLDLSSMDIFTYEDVIAEHVARTLRLQLSGEQVVRLAKRHTENSEAYEWYLRGRYYLSKRTPENFQKAIQSFEEATNADPDYALAYSGLSECYTLLNYYGVIPPETGGARAKAAAERALEADDALAEAHTAAALVAFWYDWDWLRTQIEFERAISLNPSYAPAHQWYGCYLVATRQFGQAADAGERALDLDPLVPTVNMALGKIYFFSRRYDEAIKQCERALSLDSEFIPALHFLGQAYLQKGMFREALAGYEKAMKILGAFPLGTAIVAHARALSGDRGGAEQTLSRLLELSNSGEVYVPAFAIALIHTGLVNKVQALDWLEKACDERFVWLVYLNVDPVFDSLREELRFKQLVQRMRFPEANPERWQRLEELFHAALDQSVDQRADFLAEGCGHDHDLRRELESMLVHNEQARVLSNLRPMRSGRKCFSVTERLIRRSWEGWLARIKFFKSWVRVEWAWFMSRLIRSCGARSRSSFCTGT
jgi:TolB-like protein/Tfp pilus assembly protein PilF